MQFSPLGGISTYRKLDQSIGDESTILFQKQVLNYIELYGCNIIETLSFCELEDSVVKELCFRIR